MLPNMMTGKLTALILLSAVSQIHTGAARRISVIVAEVGGNFTFYCKPVDERANMIFWYKLNIGQMVQRVARVAYNKVTVQYDETRLSVTKVDSLYLLNIMNVSKEDEATYFCQAGMSYNMDFINATHVAVTDHRKEQNSVYVEQIPADKTVQLGQGVTLQCLLQNTHQCPGGRSVYWFRAASGDSHPHIIYSYRNSSDVQGTRSCVYSLSKTLEKSSDSGTFYCAVVTCGQVLFGQGTKVEISGPHPLVAVFGALLACSGIGIAALICRWNKRTVCACCKGETSAGIHDETPTEEQPSDVVTYATMNFPSRKVKRWKNESDDCVYSAVK